jgi:hypothetical protein
MVEITFTEIAHDAGPPAPAGTRKESMTDGR